MGLQTRGTVEAPKFSWYGPLEDGWIANQSLLLVP
jgi:hypothetical protein